MVIISDGSVRFTHAEQCVLMRLAHDWAMVGRSPAMGTYLGIAVQLGAAWAAQENDHATAQGEWTEWEGEAVSRFEDEGGAALCRQA